MSSRETEVHPRVRSCDEAELRARIQGFDFDRGVAAAFPFAARLARENGWTADQAERAIEEYRRFMLLAIVAGHPVSPSEAVDQVWHLHLTYTRSYWTTFCGEVLRTPMHHEPTQGGAAERTKFAAWYEATLTSYLRVFGHAPPRDLWPAPQDRWVRATRSRGVDLSRSWIVPGPHQRDVSVLWLMAPGLLLVVGCVATCSGGAGSPFDLVGSEFLVFYMCTVLAAFAAAALLRRIALTPDSAVENLSALDVVQIAYLNGGPGLAADVAIGSLVTRGHLELDPVRRTLRPAPEGVRWYLECRHFTPDMPAPGEHERGPLDRLHPLERAAHDRVCALAPCAAGLADVRWSIVGPARRVGERLVRAGLVVGGEDVTVLPTLVALAASMFGVVKLVIGVHRDRPIGLLLAATLASIIAACLLFTRRPHRTRRGDLVLAELRATHRGIRASSHPGVRAHPGRDIIHGMALFGPRFLAGGPLAALACSPEACGGADGGGARGGCGGEGGGGGHGDGGGDGGSGSGCGGCGG